MRIDRDRDVLIGRDLRVAVRQQVRRDAAANVAQLCELMTPQVLVHEHTMDEQRNRARARLVVGDLAGRGLGAADAERRRLGGHGSVLQALEAEIRPEGARLLASSGRPGLSNGALLWRPTPRHTRFTTTSPAAAVSGLKPAARGAPNAISHVFSRGRSSARISCRRSLS